MRGGKGAITACLGLSIPLVVVKVLMWFGLITSIDGGWRILFITDVFFFVCLFAGIILMAVASASRLQSEGTVGVERGEACSMNSTDIAAIIAQKMPTARPEEFIRYGYSTANFPIYLHKPTGQRFVGNGALPGRKIPPEQVGMALQSFYTGTSITKVSRNLVPAFDTSAPSKASIYEWIVDYSKLASSRVAHDKPRTGDKWVADELVARIGGGKVWVWTVMDTDTRYILASHLSHTRTIADAEALFRQAKERAGRQPKSIVTDKLAAYPEGIERVFGGDVKHALSQGLQSPGNNNMMERLNGSIRERTKVMRGMKSVRTAEIVLDGWNTYYNYMRPHMGLDNKTPANAAKLETPFTNWEDVARMDARPFSERRILREERLRQAPVIKERPMLRDKTFAPRRRKGHLV